MKLKIKFLYREKWYYASDLSIDKDGDLYIENGHDVDGCVEFSSVKDIVLEEYKK